MNNGHPIEEMHADESSHDLNLRRRRLIRGAAYVAPMVLTLRSGSLAAASSCTGAKLLTSTTDPNGQLASSTGIAAGDTCVSDPVTMDCPSGPISEPKIIPGNGRLAGIVTSETEGSNTRYFCSGVTAQGTPVAILSSASATSFINT